MSTTVDTLVTKYVLDDQYSGQANKIASSTSGLSGKITAMAGSTGLLESGLNGVVGGLQAVLAAAVAAETALLGLSIKGFKDFAGFQSQVKALESIEGSAQKASKAMADLKKLAMQPGLGFGESVEGYLKLRNAGLDQRTSERVVSEFGNANARGGGNLQTFQQALLAVSQIAGSGKVNGQDLLQLVNAGIPIRAISKKAFGTGDTEELAKRGITSQQFLAGVLIELEKMPRVAGGAQNSLDNLSDALHFASVGFGKGLASVAGPIDQLSQVLTDLESSGNLEYFGQTIAEIFSFDVSNSSLTDGIIEFEGLLIRLNVTLKNAALSLSYFLKGVAAVARFIPGMGSVASGLDIISSGPVNRAFTGADEADAFTKRAKEELKQNQELAKIRAAKADKSEHSEKALPVATNKSTDLLQRIAFATESTAKNFDRHAFGGGDLGRQGVTVAEIGGMKHGGAPGVSHTAQNAMANALSMMIGEMMARALNGQRRGGFLGA